MSTKTKSQICPFCDVEFNGYDGIEEICGSRSEFEACTYHPSKRAKLKLKVVGDDFVKPEDDPTIVSATQSLINSGAAWHPNIDQDGSVGRSANDFIARGICKAPRGKYAKQARDRFAFMADLDARTRRA